MNTDLTSFLGQCLVSAAINLFAFLIFHKQYGKKLKEILHYFILCGCVVNDSGQSDK